MLRLRSASRACLRAFLLASAILLSGAFSQLHASLLGTVKVGTGTVETGRFTWTRDSATPGTFNTTVIPPGSVFKSFCIDTQYSNPGTYSIFDSIIGLPNPSPNANNPVQINSSNVGKIIKLVERNILTTSDPLTDVKAFKPAVLSQTQANLAFQAALWQLLGGINGGLSTVSGATLTYATNMYNDANSGLGGGLYTTYTENSSSNKFKVLGMSGNFGSSSGQDQIIIMDRLDYIQYLPVPTGVVMAGMGIVCLGGVNFLRRRKVVAAV